LLVLRSSFIVPDPAFCLLQFAFCSLHRILLPPPPQFWILVSGFRTIRFRLKTSSSHCTCQSTRQSPGESVVNRVVDCVVNWITNCISNCVNNWTPHCMTKCSRTSSANWTGKCSRQTSAHCSGHCPSQRTVHCALWLMLKRSSLCRLPYGLPTVPPMGKSCSYPLLILHMVVFADSFTLALLVPCDGSSCETCA